MIMMIMIMTILMRMALDWGARRPRRCLSFELTLEKLRFSEGGMIRLETLIELKFLNSSFSSSNTQCELFELILLSKLDKQLPVEQFERFESAVSQSAVPSPPLSYGCSWPNFLHPSQERTRLPDGQSGARHLWKDPGPDPEGG